MKTQSPPLRYLVLPAAFALVCITVSIVVWILYGGNIPLTPRGYQVNVRLPQATDVFQSSDVRTAGVSIGRVQSVVRQGDHAEATISVDARYVPLRAGAHVLVRNKTLLGEGFLEVSFGPRSAPAIPDGGTLLLSSAIHQQRLGDVLQTFTPATRTDLRRMFSGLGRALAGPATGALNGSLAYGAATVQSLDQVAGTLDAEQRPVQALISNGGQILTTLGEHAGSVQAAIRAGNQVLQVTARQRSALSSTIAALPSFLSRLRAAATALHAASSPLTQAVDALTPVAPRLAPALAAIDRAGPQLTGLFRGLPAVLSAGDAGLPAVQKLASAVGTSFANVHTAAQQVLPLAQLLAVARNSVVGGLADVASLIEGTLMGPGNASAHDLGAALSFWNELPAGWIRKLPTNRENAYPAPNSAADIARGGLRAYDCRNIHNPLYLPPTGTGVPACVQQAPWTFDGVARRYPHLTESPP